MAQHTKLIVFLSSALDDRVKDDRTAVETAMKAWADTIEFRSSDNFVASGQSVRDISLAAVRQAHIYIGIFADRAGEMTSEEYDCAKQLGLNLLMFFRKQPQTMAGALHLTADRRRLARIRGELEGYEQPLFKEYSTSDELRALISEALVKARDQRSITFPAPRRYEPPPKHLATLCDRRQQEPIVDKLLESVRHDPTRPKILLFGVPGRAAEDHDAFVEWYHTLRLRPDFGAAVETEARAGATTAPSLEAAKHVKTNFIPLVWHSYTAPPRDRFARLLTDLARGVSQAQTETQTQTPLPSDESALTKLILQTLDGAQRDFTLRYHLYSEFLQADDCELLEMWARFLLQLPLTTNKYVVTAFFCFQRPDSRWKSLTFASRHLNSCIKALKTLQHQALTNLPELRSPSHDDAKEWASTRCQRYYAALDRDTLLKAATRPFEDGASALPFVRLKPVLEAALESAYQSYYKQARDSKESF